MLAEQRHKEVNWKRINRNDCQLYLSGAMPDTLSTVIAIVIDKAIPSFPIRLLNERADNTLYTFDSQLIGNGLGYGDGKVNRNYVRNWTGNHQKMLWSFRVNKEVRYSVYLDYNTEEVGNSGVVSVTFDKQSFDVPYQGFTEQQGTKRIKVGSIVLKKGSHTCCLQGKSYLGKQYMRPISITLIKEN